MYILINFIDSYQSIDRNNKDRNNDMRYNLVAKLAKGLKEKDHNIYVCSIDSNDKKNITKYGWGKHIIFGNERLKEYEKKNYILFDYNRDKDKIELIIGWVHGIKDNLEDIKQDFKKDIPLIYYENGRFKDSITVDPGGLLWDSKYYTTINNLCEEDYDKEKCNLFIKNYLSNNNSKRPQNSKTDIPDSIKGKYIFLPTQKAKDYCLKNCKLGMLGLIKKLTDYCSKREIYLVVKIHPHIVGEDKNIQFNLLKKLRNKYLIISNSSINYLVQNAIFTVTLNGGTVFDNFINQSPVLVLYTGMMNNTDAVVYSEDFEKGMEKMMKKDYNIEKMLDKQKKIVWWYITHNCFLENSCDENINNLQKHLEIKF